MGRSRNQRTVGGGVLLTQGLIVSPSLAFWGNPRIPSKLLPPQPMAGRSFFVADASHSTPSLDALKRLLQMAHLLLQGRFTLFQRELARVSMVVHPRATTIHHFCVSERSWWLRGGSGVNHSQHPLQSRVERDAIKKRHHFHLIFTTNPIIRHTRLRTSAPNGSLPHDNSTEAIP